MTATGRRARRTPRIRRATFVWKARRRRASCEMCACRGAAGVAHVSCLARQAKILVAEAEERDLDDEAVQARWDRWNTCRLCEQRYHGVVMCALGWACWKTYVGRPEEHWARRMAMNQLANGLAVAEYHEDSLSVREAELATEERLGASPLRTLATRGNLALSYYHLGRIEDALRLQRGSTQGGRF